jgi:hypothetical protein
MRVECGSLHIPCNVCHTLWTPEFRNHSVWYHEQLVTYCITTWQRRVILNRLLVNTLCNYSILTLPTDKYRHCSDINVPSSNTLAFTIVHRESLSGLHVALNHFTVKHPEPKKVDALVRELITPNNNNTFFMELISLKNWKNCPVVN